MQKLRAYGEGKEAATMPVHHNGKRSFVEEVMSWNTPDSIRITHPTGHRALVEVPYRKSLFKAKAFAFQMLRGKLWAAPCGPKDAPAGDVQICDLRAHGQAFWSDGASIDAVGDRMAAELGERLDAAMERRRADLDRRIFLPTEAAVCD